MKIITKKTLDVTPSLETYINTKLSPLAKFLSRFETSGEVELRLEVSRTSVHHRKGDEVFMASVELLLPKKKLHAEASAADIRSAIDGVRETVQMEIEKYKEQRLDHRREGKDQ